MRGHLIYLVNLFQKFHIIIACFLEVHHREDYKKALNIFTREAKTSKGKFEMKMAEKIKHDLKSLFSYARSKSRTKHRVAPLTDRNGDVTTDNFDKSLILNEFFSSFFAKENTNSISHPEQVFTGRDQGTHVGC